MVTFPQDIGTPNAGAGCLISTRTFHQFHQVVKDHFSRCGNSRFGTERLNLRFAGLEPESDCLVVGVGCIPDPQSLTLTPCTTHDYIGASSMAKYFRGWRRKAGVLVLGLALALTGGWVRSSFIADGLLMISRGRPMIGALSIDHYLGFAVSKSEIETGWPVWASRQEHTFNEQFGDKVLWRCFCLAYAETTDDKIWFVAYWSIVIPLTLLSAYLLLSKPRIATVRETDRAGVPALGPLI